ncbi:serB [Mytilus coruscus]|uniref:Phosphoserine phosphatase n=1 Tax=Mytilus coruscus TaxID=42192 RepID=A0A6J8D348_MYTCO|nr:serB [Mytilus coruscus]
MVIPFRRLFHLPIKMLSQEQCKRVWRNADAVCFDVDSTVLKDEALDELAKFCGVGELVIEWTNKAMGGNVSFREALNERLKIVQPTRQKVADFLSQHPPQFTPGIKSAFLIKVKPDKHNQISIPDQGKTRPAFLIKVKPDKQIRSRSAFLIKVKPDKHNQISIPDQGKTRSAFLIKVKPDKHS